MSRSAQGKNAGFTLVELLAVIAILAILATATFVVNGKMLQNQQSKSTAYEIAQFLKSAASRGFNTREDLDYIINYTSKTITITDDGDSTVIDQLNLSDKFNYTRTSGSTETFTGWITDRGKMQTNSIIVLSKSGEKLYKITIYGMYSIKDTAINVYKYTKGVIGDSAIVTY